MTVSVLFQARHYLQHLPRVSGAQRDVLGIPNSVRAVLGLTMRTYDHWDLLDMHNNICTYFRLLHVKATHTARDIFDAICFIEGWNNVGFQVSLHYEVPMPSEECTVAQMIELSQNYGVPACPTVSWLYAMEPLRQHSAPVISAATQHGTDDSSDSGGGDEEHTQSPIYYGNEITDEVEGREGGAGEDDSVGEYDSAGEDNSAGEYDSAGEDDSAGEYDSAGENDSAGEYDSASEDDSADRNTLR